MLYSKRRKNLGGGRKKRSTRKSNMYGGNKVISYCCGKYSGEVNDKNIPHGKGKFEYHYLNNPSTFSMYDGDWSNGLPHGKGTLYSFSKKELFTGNFTKGVPNDDKGTCTYEFNGDMRMAKDIHIKDGYVEKSGNIWDLNLLKQSKKKIEFICPELSPTTVNYWNETTKEWHHKS
jgi:hypothetical protein